MSPIYEYHCQACGNNFERTRPYEGSNLVSCPCGARADKKMSVFSHHWLNPLTVDGEGFTTKQVSPRELSEMNQEVRER